MLWISFFGEAYEGGVYISTLTEYDRLQKMKDEIFLSEELFLS